MRCARAFVIVCLAACHPLHTDAPLTPNAICRTCCAQAFDACRLDTDAFPMARCPPKYRECTLACDQNDDNEMCVVQTKREVAAAQAKSAAPPAALVKTEPERRGECDSKGTWKLTIAAPAGEARGCTALAAIPKQVTFRIARRRGEYALHDLTPAPGWTDAFSIDNSDDECSVEISRTSQADPRRPRAIAVRLTERDRAVTGSFRYEETGQAQPCTIEAAVTGSVTPPPPEPLPPPPPPMPPPSVVQPPRPGSGDAR